jgi:hypothetical protein
MTRGCFLWSAPMLLGAALPGTEVKKPESAGASKLKSAIADARTPADHERISMCYQSEADRLMTVSAEHEELSLEYRRLRKVDPARYSRYEQAAEHIGCFAEYTRQAALQLTELAKRHQEMAGRQTSEPARYGFPGVSR